MNVRKLISATLFSLVAILSFSVWAFGSSLFPSEPLMYAGCAIVFLGVGGAALLPAVGFSGKSGFQFCIAFAVGYLIYAVIWSVAWFTIPRTIGEVVGSLIGLIAFGLLLRKWMNLDLPILSGVAILFLFHTIGYYLGSFAYDSLQNRGPAGIELKLSPQTIRTTARLSWGVFYGIGVALGVINFCHLSRQSSDKPSTQI
jgi:hypothetical protein